MQIVKCCETNYFKYEYKGTFVHINLIVPAVLWSWGQFTL
jgi:hypothetical protein